MVTIKGDGPVVRRKRSIEPVGESENFGLHIVGMGIVGRGGDGPSGCFVGTRQHLGGFGIPTIAVDGSEGLSEPDSGLTILGIDSQSILEQPDGPLQILLVRASVQDGPATHGEVHRIRVNALRPAAFSIDEFNTEHPGESVRDAEVVLESQRALVDVHLFDPQMRAGGRVDELRVDADGASQPAYASLEHIPNTQLSANLPDIDGSTLECEGSVPGDNEASSNSRQITGQVFSYAIGKVVLARVATEVAEGQHED